MTDIKVFLKQEVIMKETFEKWYGLLHSQFIEHLTYKDFCKKPTKELSLKLVENVCKSHLRSPQVLGFLFSVVPPRAIDNIKHNLFEELGVEKDGDQSHPDLLVRLGKAVGFNEKKWSLIEKEAQQVLKNKIDEPLMFGSLREVGLNVMLEVIGFEWFLSRESRTIGNVLKKSLNLNEKDLEWFFHHSEVDIQHAEEGLETLEEYVNYYGLDKETVQNIGEITFRDNVFLKRYFDIQIESQL
jgi:hypothetical protein